MTFLLFKSRKNKINKIFLFKKNLVHIIRNLIDLHLLDHLYLKIRILKLLEKIIIWLVVIKNKKMRDHQDQLRIIAMYIIYLIRILVIDNINQNRGNK